MNSRGWAEGVEGDKRWGLAGTRGGLAEGIPRPALGLPWVRNSDYPVKGGWKLLPWNKGRDPAASTYVRYLDEDFRIMADRDGEVFVYCRVDEA